MGMGSAVFRYGNGSFRRRRSPIDASMESGQRLHCQAGWAESMPNRAGLATWSGALAGLLLILIGSLLPAALLVPLPLTVVELPATWQVPACCSARWSADPEPG